MSASAHADPHQLGHGGHGGHGNTGSGVGGPAPKRIVTAYGFWIFLLSDIVMFSGFFAAYAVLGGATAGGPSGHQLFHLPQVAAETALLLVSSFTCGLAGLASARRRMAATQAWLLVTGLLGFGFLLIEVNEFVGMIAAGAGPQRSGFLSAFFALVGCHGMHISAGLLWLGTMMAQLWVKGFADAIQRRLNCLFLFWHALDIVWVAIFTIVYLMGVGR